MLDARPAAYHRIEHESCASGVGDVGGRQVHCQQPAFCIDCDVSLAATNFLVSVVASFTRTWNFDRLAVHDANRGNHLLLLAHPVEHQRQILSDNLNCKPASDARLD